MVRKIKQSQKQKQSLNVKIHIGDTNKRRRRNNKRKSGGGGGGRSSGYQQSTNAYTPVYIQSGTPETEFNPLLRATQDLNGNISRTHIEKVENPLLKQVSNHIQEAIPIDEYKGNIVEARRIEPELYEKNLYRNLRVTKISLQI